MAAAPFRSSSEPERRGGPGAATLHRVGSGTPMLSCRTVDTDQLQAEHYLIRERVFVSEQGLFTGHDRDRTDDLPAVIHVVGHVDGVAAGTVRLYPVEPELPGESLWKGDRLAVLPDHRHAGLGAPLVRFAVRTAGELGGDRMVAHIQLENVVFFRRLGWSLVGDPTLYVGVPHQKMSIGLG